MNITETFRNYMGNDHVRSNPQTAALLTIAAVINEASEKQPIRVGLTKRPPLTPEQKAQMMEMAKAMMSSPTESFTPAAKSTESIPEVKPPIT